MMIRSASRYTNGRTNSDGHRDVAYTSLSQRHAVKLNLEAQTQDGSIGSDKFEITRERMNGRDAYETFAATEISLKVTVSKCYLIYVTFGGMEFKALSNKSVFSLVPRLSIWHARFAAERRAAMPRLLSIDISCLRGAQQQTRRCCFWSMGETDGQRDWQTDARPLHRPC